MQGHQKRKPQIEPLIAEEGRKDGTGAKVQQLQRPEKRIPRARPRPPGKAQVPRGTDADKGIKKRIKGGKREGTMGEGSNGRIIRA